MIISASGRRIAAVCDLLIGEEEVVVKSLGPLLAPVRGYLGASILGDGRIALLLDPATLVRGPRATHAQPAPAAEPVPPPEPTRRCWSWKTRSPCASSSAASSRRRATAS